MGFNIKNEAVHRLARRLAAREGVTLTRAVEMALENELKRGAKGDDPEFDRKYEAFVDLIRKRPPPPSGVTSNHDDLYDEHGLPA